MDAQAHGRVADVDSQIKYQIREFYVVPRHFVSLRIARCLMNLAMSLISWCPHTAKLIWQNHLLSGVFCHTARLRNRSPRLKLVLSDNTGRFPRPLEGLLAK